MIRVMVMANDPLLVDVIASILVVEMEMHPDVLQLTYHLPRNIYETLFDPRSIVIVIDEGSSEHESIKVPGSFRYNRPLLLIRTSLKTRNIDLYECNQLTKPGNEQAIELVMNFIDTNLKNRKGYEYGFPRNEYNTSAANMPIQATSSI
jgi:hypothetical protein